MLPIEQCYGVIVVFKEEENKFLLLEQLEKKNDWTFAKGHIEKGESPIECTKRELKEETGILDIDIQSGPLVHEEYEIFRDNEKIMKMNDYYIGFVKEKSVKIEKEEIQSYKWVSYEEALILFEHENRKQVLREAQNYLKNESRK